MANRTREDMTARMKEIREARRQAGFAEVNVWVPRDKVEKLRGFAWTLVDAAGRSFPHRSPRRRGKYGKGET
ncbi:hypothetical protein [Shimia sp. FJ5]|uniref:hypothetical protein n=1 Tax=Shimia sp. FJ5 TaxID=3079054 RepID=UPI00293DCB34|nr:hypothetical protein [Shimia sp. FJ5]MDV4146441.1 hypothetical protein [Shimia sp. FJ5]